MEKILKFTCCLFIILILGWKWPYHQLGVQQQHLATSYTNNIQANLWDRLVNNFQLEIPDSKQHRQLQLYLQRYSHNAYTIKELSKLAIPYLFHIVEELEQRNLPGELALLPMIESAYRPHARSNRNAYGLWQIMPSTAKRFGLKHDNWYDGRCDITASTQVALDYLQFLYNEFDQDWLLAFAAYNAGEGRVRQAIRRNKALGKSTDFWSLNLPAQTKHYVPKLLALAHVIRNPSLHGSQLIPIENRPYFVTLTLSKQIDLNQAAKLAQVDISEIKKLNPAYKKFVTHPNGPHHLLIPYEKAHILNKNMALIDKV